MAGALAAAVNIPVVARSVGGTSSQDGAIVFRIPGIGQAYTAHVSEDATVFVQSREVLTTSQMFTQCVLGVPGWQPGSFPDVITAIVATMNTNIVVLCSVVRDRA